MRTKLPWPQNPRTTETFDFRNCAPPRRTPNDHTSPLTFGKQRQRGGDKHPEIMFVVPKVKDRCALHNYLKGKQASQTVEEHKSNMTNCLASLLEAQAREGESTFSSKLHVHPRNNHSLSQRIRPQFASSKAIEQILPSGAQVREGTLDLSQRNCLCPQRKESCHLEGWN